MKKEKSKQRILKLLVFVFTILFALSFNVTAHEFSPSRYWNDIYFNSSTRKHVVRLKINISNVTNLVYNRTHRTAISNWELYGDGYCDTEITATGTDIMVYDTYPATQNQNAYAVTVSTCSNATIYEYPYGITGGSTAKSCQKITKARVYVNQSKQSADNFSENDIIKTWAHELGHIIGFNETNDGTQTVMRQGKGSTFGWGNYWRPQTHDTTDLLRYRYVSWS